MRLLMDELGLLDFPSIHSTKISFALAKTCSISILHEKDSNVDLSILEEKEKEQFKLLINIIVVAQYLKHFINNH